MVFRAKGGKTFKLRVDHPDGRYATLSTGCRVRSDAVDVEALVDRWRGLKGKRYARPDVLDALVSKRVTLKEAARAAEEGTLDALIARHPPEAPNLAVEIDAWLAGKALSGRGAGQTPTYRKQMATLYPEIAAGTFTLALFTRRELWLRLDALEVDHPTKNRYRAAASSFAKYLVKRELIDRHFTREIEGFGENDPRLVYYEIADARRLVDALEQPYRAIAAAALGFCMEWGALDRALVGDFDMKTSPVITHVRGTKRSWRDRYVPLVPELSWVLDAIRPALAGKLPGAKAFDDVPEWVAIDAQRAGADALELTAVGEAEFGQHSIHDWRHTHAVALLRWGYSEQIVADHEGHKNTTLVRERYGRFKPTAYDYAKPKAGEAQPGRSKRRKSAK